MPPTAIETLRRELREKFPQAHALVAESEPWSEVLDSFSMDAFPAEELRHRLRVENERLQRVNCSPVRSVPCSGFPGRRHPAGLYGNGPGGRAGR